ncbi:hypothetical protein [Streptomyces sp. NPDC097610]|uniref:hypothetical protein n=1 Tax=Streptomyces sp. NPDC097610 TaxID=3157227 RepID=UPI00331B998E
MPDLSLRIPASRCEIRIATLGDREYGAQILVGPSRLKKARQSCMRLIENRAEIEGTGSCDDANP